MIEKNVIISVRGEQYFEDIDPDTVELTTEGRMTIHDDGSMILAYDETELTGMEGTTTRFTIDGSRVVLRRSGTTVTEKKARRLSVEGLTIDLDSYELYVSGRKVEAPPKEMELLYYLASSPNRVYTRNQLLDEVWGFDYFGDSRTVDVHVKRLREKLEGVCESWSLKTVWGVGYKFEAL